jgi:WhiB family redox-sensing transcriptional regulator
MRTAREVGSGGGLLEEDRPFPCQVDAPLFFAAEPARLERAKVLCADCPVRTACLAGAIERLEPWGVWGGELFEGGRIVERKRPRGRPRKVRQSA